MNAHRRGTLAAALAVLALLGLVLGTALSTSRAGQEPKRTRSEFMRQKLEFSKNVLEGLSLEQYPMIEKNARSLKVLSQAAEWEVPTIPNATDYVAMTTEFQRYADELIKNARNRNIDGATLAYLKLTMNCVQCHKFVRFASR
jgi:cytochrome c556